MELLSTSKTGRTANEEGYYIKPAPTVPVALSPTVAPAMDPLAARTLYALERAQALPAAPVQAQAADEHAMLDQDSQYLSVPGSPGAQVESFFRQHWLAVTLGGVVLLGAAWWFTQPAK